jgi:hypothetical protein
MKIRTPTRVKRSRTVSAVRRATSQREGRGTHGVLVLAEGYPPAFVTLQFCPDEIAISAPH